MSSLNIDVLVKNQLTAVEITKSISSSGGSSDKLNAFTSLEFGASHSIFSPLHTLLTQFTHFVTYFCVSVPFFYTNITYDCRRDEDPQL